LYFFFQEEQEKSLMQFVAARGCVLNPAMRKMGPGLELELSLTEKKRTGCFSDRHLIEDIEKKAVLVERKTC
jgi:hypothetical protein